MKKNFTKLSENWWKIDGEMSMLHAINPIRIEYINKILFKNENRKLKILDFGCGGGILSEEMAKLGHHVFGFDENESLIEIAKDHSSGNFDNLKYSSNIDEIDDSFDLILCMEVIEHVDDLQNFIENLTKKLKSNGVIIFSTINRTKSSFLFAKLMAEYVLKIVPKGIHSFEKFVKPSELCELVKNCKNIDLTGLSYNPINKKFSFSNNVNVNYFASFIKN